MSGRFPFEERQAQGLGGRFFGVYPALVRDLADPDSQGRVQVELPWSPDAGGSGGLGYRAWARMATLMAGGGRGTWFIPDVDDEVLVAFEAGDPRRPYVVGALWNGVDAPPEQMDGSGQNNLKTIHSRSGVRVAIDDTSGAEKLTLETPGGHSVVLDDSARTITVTDSNGNIVELASSGVTITASAQVKVDASTMEVNVGMLTVNAGMSKFSGVVQADTVITNSVVSSSYTPGAGNIW